MPPQDNSSNDPVEKNIELAPTLSTVAGDTAEQVVGPYHLARRLGEGGMGEVWLAEQKEPVRRRVALKLIKRGMNTREALVRFDSERQALALMDHPNIARVFDAGATLDGAPYFVMEYVSGIPITHYCDQHRLSTRERLEAFAQVCEGVQHAHQKAIIHRDLKPSNILVGEVDSRLVAKIIDFGVAKALSQKLTAETMWTRAGALVGTPEYMSPEQASSSGEDIDTRSDVYSLGIIFYELLAGTPPLEIRQLTLEEFLRKLREEEPARPSTKISTGDPATSTDVARKRQTDPQMLARQLRGELDSIALKALEKERSRRYASAADLVADVRRFLNNEPVLAVPPSLIYRARKFSRRHRAALATASAFALVLIAASVVSVRQSIRANREAAASQRVVDFMTKMFKIADPSEARGNSVTAREILDNASKNIDTGLANDPQLQGRMMSVMGIVYETLGLFKEGEPLLRHAVEVRQRTLGVRNKDTLQSMHDLSVLLGTEGKISEAEKLCRDALDGRKAILGNEDPETLRAKEWLGWLLFLQGKFPDAEKLYREVIDVAEPKLGHDAELTKTGMNRLGIDFIEEGKYPDAEKVLRDVLATDKRLLGSNDKDTLGAMVNLASVLEKENNLPEAEQLERTAYQAFLQGWGPEHPRTTMTMEDLATTLHHERRYAEAEKLLREALAVERKRWGSENPSTLLTAGNLADLLTDEGKYPEAESLLRQTLEAKRKIMGPEHPSTLVALDELGKVLQKERRYPEAEKTYRDALDGRSRVLGAGHPDTAATAYGLACVLALQGKRDEAFTNLQFAADHSLSDELRKGLQNDPDLNTLHADPRFLALAVHIN
jgi:non-specific serine/threonine protein kinase/serine/threonine-protein kinase